MNNEKKYREALQKIADFEENFEDYYGGTSINYYAIVKDIIKIANVALAANTQDRTKCDVYIGCCEPCLETSYNLSMDELKKVIKEA